jgi:2-oxoglutarate ferredoxin oxidoreductase subunit gamma
MMTLATVSTTTTAGLRREIIFTGFGGQGIVLAGRIVGEAASLGDHRESTLTQSYGPEARGGACSAHVIIADGTIHYPYVRRPDILVCMSQGGYDKFGDLLKENGILLTDEDLVASVNPSAGTQFFPIPATRMAEEQGRKMMANIVMVGFFTAVTGVLSIESARSAVAAAVPKNTIDMNLNAFTRGHDYGLAVLKGRMKKAEGKKGARG